MRKIICPECGREDYIEEFGNNLNGSFVCDGCGFYLRDVEYEYLESEIWQQHREELYDEPEDLD